MDKTEPMTDSETIEVLPDLELPRRSFDIFGGKVWMTEDGNVTEVCDMPDGMFRLIFGRWLGD